MASSRPGVPSPQSPAQTVCPGANANRFHLLISIDESSLLLPVVGYGILGPGGRKKHLLLTWLQAKKTTGISIFINAENVGLFILAKQPGQVMLEQEFSSEGIAVAECIS